MKSGCIIPAIFLLTFAACKQPGKAKATVKYDPCINGHDTTFYLQFSTDTSTTNFYKLIDFIESKGEFSRFNKKNKIDSSFGNDIFLQKLVCENKYSDSPKEYWVLDSIFSIRYYMTSRIPVKGTKNYFPKFHITQFNFTTEKEKEIAYDKINEIGWGDPQHKWNDYFIAVSRTRIIILRSDAQIFSETMNKYGRMIQKEWIDKNNR